MGNNKKYFWLKFKEDFFRDKKIKKLRKIAGGDTYTIIYLKMQLLSLKNGGNLYFEGIEDTFADEIALEIDEDEDNVKITLAFLIKNGLIEQLDEDTYSLIQTKQCIGVETASTLRSRKSRALKKEQLALQCNTNATNCNTEIDIEKEIDIDRDKELKKDKNKKIYFENIDLNNLFLEFLEVRKKLKAVNSERAINTLIKQLNNYDDNTKYQMIENSIVNSWKGVYELKQQKNYSNKPIREEIVPDWFKEKNEVKEPTIEEQEELDDIINDLVEDSFEERREALKERLKNKYGKGEDQ